MCLYGWRCWLQAAQGSEGCGAAWLYFGCRARREDYLYGEDWEGFLGDGTLTRLRTAFSREQDAKVGGWVGGCGV
jgi:sulfite reductase (NADPH) flavoprotein alpha-component